MKFNFQKTAKKLSVLIKRYEKIKGLSTGKKWSVLAGIWRQGMMYFQKNACHFKSSNTVFNHGHRRLKNRPTNEGHSQLSFDINFAMTWTFLSSFKHSSTKLDYLTVTWDIWRQFSHSWLFLVIRPPFRKVQKTFFCPRYR